MRTLDPGHIFALDMLDIQADERQSTEMLVFVKREGPRYPGNVSHFPGTNCQEVIRALIDRVKYLDSQNPDDRNPAILQRLREALWLFEARAAERYGRTLPPLDSFQAIEEEAACPRCAHIRCGGECKKK